MTMVDAGIGRGFRYGALVCARLLVAAFSALTMLYAVVASSTFAYLQFLRPRVFPWTGTFADWHAVMAWLWLALLLFALSDHLRRRWRGRRWAWALAAACGVMVALNTYAPMLPRLAPTAISEWVALAALMPLVSLAAIDVAGAWGATRPLVPSVDVDAADGSLLSASALAAGTLTVLFASIAALRVTAGFEPDVTALRWAQLAARSAVHHFTVFTVLFLLVALVTRLAAWLSPLWRWALWAAVIAGGGAVVVDRTLAAALTLTGVFRYVLAALAGLAVLGSWMGMRLAGGCDAIATRHPFELLFGMRSDTLRSRPLVAIAVLAALAGAVPLVSAAADWDDVVLRLGTILVWVIAFGGAYRSVPPSRRLTNRTVVLACVSPLVALASGAAFGETEASQRALARYLVYDPSFRLARGLVVSDRTDVDAFDRYLRANTDLTGVTLSPTSIDFVPDLAPAAVRPPVFVFVVDSLRHDYLAPYNPKVWFTPAIAAFAAESTVFTNAFTRYGGTGLSVPAIWAGSALPHKQYVTPFSPMNTLEKLLDVNGYTRFVSLDSIMGPLLEPSTLTEELDRGITVMDYEWCRTLSELERKLADAPAGLPVFAYSLPQDVHMSRLSRWATPSGDFSGFHAPYAGRIQAMDACFGRFVQALRRLGLYERSLIVVTSDHGELLGEHGQFGHSYHMRPEVVRVPLIVHFPTGVAGTTRVDPDALALSTDIAPTIYATLGYQVSSDGTLMGRPLLDETNEARERRRREAHVLTASYGAVYAVVSRNGRRLYVADAVKGEDHLYERRSGTAPWSERPLSVDTRAIEQYIIRQHVDRTSKVFAVPRRDPS